MLDATTDEKLDAVYVAHDAEEQNYVYKNMEDQGENKDTEQENPPLKEWKN